MSESTMEPAEPKASRERSIPGALGWFLLASGLIINRWTLTFLFARDGFISGNYKIAAIVFFQAFCVLFGSYILVRNHGRERGNVLPSPLVAALLCLPIALIVAVGERGLRAYLTAHDHTVEHGAGGAEPTAEQRQWADEFVRRCREAAERNGWFDFEKAMADGYAPMNKLSAHYPNQDFLFDDHVLDPDRPEYLMYRDTPRGKLLMGYMFFARNPEERGPRPGGSLTLWHSHPWTHRGVCLERGMLPVAMPNDDGECEMGTLARRSPEMLHVWFLDHPLGRFATAMDFPAEKSMRDVKLLHPALVHFTIALFIVSVLLDVAGITRRKPGFHSAAWINLVLAVALGIGTVIAGMAAEMRLLLTPENHHALHTHKILGFSVLACMGLLTVWRGWLRGAFPARGAVLYLLLGLSGVALTAVTAYYGGELVYVRGVGVQALDRQALERHEEQVFGQQAPVGHGHH